MISREPLRLPETQPSAVARAPQQKPCSCSRGGQRGIDYLPRYAPPVDTAVSLGQLGRGSRVGRLRAPLSPPSFSRTVSISSTLPSFLVLEVFDTGHAAPVLTLPSYPPSSRLTEGPICHVSRAGPRGSDPDFRGSSVCRCLKDLCISPIKLGPATRTLETECVGGRYIIGLENLAQWHSG